MTEEELKKVPFHVTLHLAAESEYITSYESKDGRLGFCDHVARDEDGFMKKGARSYRHYMIEGKVYKKKEKFIEALRDFDPDNR